MKRMIGIYFFQCSTSVNCWHAAGLFSIMQSRIQSFGSMGTILMDVCGRETEDFVSRVLMVVWGIWLNRNDWLCNQKKLTAAQIVKLVQSLLVEWKAVQNYAANGMTVDSSHTVGGSAVSREFQCFVDASFYRLEGIKVLFLPLGRNFCEVFIRMELSGAASL